MRAPEFGIDAVLRQKLRVRALLFQTALVEYEYVVGVHHRAQAVGGHEHGFAAHEFFERAHNQGFVFRVGVGGGFVQYQDGAALQDGAGNGDALALTAGKRRAAFADRGGVALWQFGDEIVGVGGAGGVFDVGLRGIGDAQPDVVGNAAGEEEIILEHKGNLRH